MSVVGTSGLCFSCAPSEQLGDLKGVPFFGLFVLLYFLFYFSFSYIIFFFFFWSVLMRVNPPTHTDTKQSLCCRFSDTKSISAGLELVMLRCLRQDGHPPGDTVD